ncbi:MAG: hypothetical protein EBT03_07840 [Betaproteobacteria bacterium]|nr:hypothetical protein [Betaproteobacteria bacterium]
MKNERIHAARIEMTDDPDERREVVITRLERRITTLQDLCDLMMVDSLVTAPVREEYALDIQSIVSVMQSAMETLSTFRFALLEEAEESAKTRMAEALKDEDGEDKDNYDA